MCYPCCLILSLCIFTRKRDRDPLSQGNLFVQINILNVVSFPSTGILSSLTDNDRKSSSLQEKTTKPTIKSIAAFNLQMDKQALVVSMILFKIKHEIKSKTPVGQVAGTDCRSDIASAGLSRMVSFPDRSWINLNLFGENEVRLLILYIDGVRR